MHVQTLQSIADAEHRLALAVRVVEQEIIDGVAAGIGRGGLRRTRRPKARRINVSFAAGQKHAIATRDQAQHFDFRLIKLDASRLASSQRDSPFVLWNGALGVLGIGTMR